MNDNDIRRRYKAQFEKLTASDELRQKTLASIEASDVLDDLAKTRSVRIRPRKDRTTPIMYLAAACLVLIVLAAGSSYFASSLRDNQFPLTNIDSSHSGETVTPIFSINAYIPATNSFISLDNLEDLTFINSMAEEQKPGSSEANTIPPTSAMGVYTSFLFVVQGESIKQVKLDVSFGELYLYSKDSSSYQRLGSHVDFISDGTQQIYGLWSDQVSANDLSRFNGETVAVTVYGQNGYSSTQVIKLVVDQNHIPPILSGQVIR